jgi:tetratricopeptide (TPR) repeat protein
VTVEQMVATIRQAAETSATELDVQPLRDPQVEDLRQQAAALQAGGHHQQAAALLQEALEVNPDDPAVLQEVAEAHLYLWQFDEAEKAARRAHGLGSGVGPLCRRHWATVEQVAQARLAIAADPDPGQRGRAAIEPGLAAQTAQQARVDAAAAREAREACTVSAPQRF